MASPLGGASLERRWTSWWSTWAGSLACEVKAGDSRGILSRSARSFVDAYQPEELVIVNRRTLHETEVGSTRVRFLRAEELAGAVEAFLNADRVPAA
jgi:hypothetical protein